jgi:hypothetical protein
MPKYAMEFVTAIWLTEIDKGGGVIGDYKAERGQRFRVVQKSVSHESGPGVEFTHIAMAHGGSIWTERQFIVPTAALETSSGLM